MEISEVQRTKLMEEMFNSSIPRSVRFTETVDYLHNPYLD